MDVVEAAKFAQDGASFCEKADWRRAYEAFVQAVNLNPDETSYRVSLAITAQTLAMENQNYHEIAYQQACEACRQQPGVATNWIALGQVAKNSNRYKESIVAYEKAIELDPNNPLLWVWLGFMNTKAGNEPRGIQCCLRAVQIDPEYGDAHFMLASMCHGETFNNAAMAYHGEKAFSAAKKCEHPMDAMWNAAHGFLGVGAYEKGWGYFEARHFRSISNAGQQLLSERFKKPKWNGEKDCRILIMPEMGFGDVFVMLRYLPMLKDFNLKVKFEANPAYSELLQMNFPWIEITQNTTDDQFDFYAPLMSMPNIFKTRKDNIPWNGPYILPQNDGYEEQWSVLRTFVSHDKPNIGLCWSSGENAYNPSNFFVHQKKSVPLDKLAPLLALENVNFVSLQTGDQGKLFPGPELKTFTQTAQILDMLDGVVCVDTAICNLAGAMGKKVWLMDRFDHDWRYFDGLKTPWFPTVKPFRQKKLGEWEPVIQRICDELKGLSSKVAA